MAAKKKWGAKEAFKLDPMTVSMKHPSATAALLAGGQAVKSHFATLPTSFAELTSGNFGLPSYVVVTVIDDGLFYATGPYTAFSDNYKMAGQVRIVSRPEFDQWIADKTAEKYSNGQENQ